MSDCKQMSILSCITELDESSPKKCADQATTILVSPISGIVHELMNTTLSQHNCSKRKNNITNENLDSYVQHGHSDQRGYHEGLFKNAFKIKNTDDSVKSKPKARRLLGMGSRCFSSPEPVSPSFDKENNSVACISHTSSASPQKSVGVKRLRHPLEDWDPNSQDSGYEASFLEKEEKSKRDRFRFVEPLAVAPRRLSECRSPMESPIRSSPQRARVARPSLFRSLSSGYESMDDGFNELIDENSDGTTELPNGISTLLCGDIVSCDVENEMISDSNPSTPEFPRTNNGASGFRRSLLLQDGRQEDRRNSSLSKVRSCLFRSPNASSSTVNPGFEDTSPLASTMPVTRRRRISSDFVDRNGVANCGAENNSPLFVRTFKRPDPPINDSPKLIKKSRMSSSFNDIEKECDVSEGMAFDVKYVQRNFSSSDTVMPAAIEATNIEVDVEMESETETEVKSEDETHAHIKSAIHRSITDADLTGDFSKPCVLPLAVGHHEDLKSISVDTLAALIHGEFSDRIGSFKIVDCRYPYEFDAGHIQGALNLYSKDLIEQILLDPLTNRPEIQPDTNKRSILVFHCEFSWERGPNLSRFLRSLDRQRNKEHYPALYYPEVYLLHGGYEKFYKEQKGLCTPQGYRPMRHPDNQADLRQFRNKSKSWQGEKSRIGGSATRNNLKRLGF